MARSLDDIFGNSNKKRKTLDEIFAPPEPVEPINPVIKPFSAHTSTLPTNTSPIPDFIKSILDQSSTWDKLKVGDIKGLASDLGVGLAHGLANTGTAKLNNSFDQMLARSNEPGTSAYGQQQLANRQTQQNYLDANPVNSLPAMLGEQIPQIPLWMAGEAGLKAVGKGIGKLAPSFASATEKIASKLPSNVKGGLMDAATYGAVVNPVDSIRNGDSFSQFLENEKGVPGVFLGGALTRGAIGAPGLAKDVIGEGGSLKQALALRKLNPVREISSNPLQDVQNAYKPNATLRDARANQYPDIFSGEPMATTQRLTPRLSLQSQGLTDAELQAQRQLDAQSAFGGQKDVKKYAFTTGEQRAFQELQDGIAEAQNYVRHTDVLAPYPPGTTIKQAYADIKSNTGIDLPGLMDNWNKTQSLKNKMTPEELRLGRISGVVPGLKPRDVKIPQPLEQLPTQRILPDKPGRLTWTNKDNIPSAGPLPLRSITPDNVGGLPKSPVMPLRTPSVLNETTSVEMPVSANGRPNNGTGIQPPLRTMAADIKTGNTPSTPTLTINPGAPEGNRAQIVSTLNKEKVPFTEKLQKLYNATVNNTQGIDRTVKGTRLTGEDNAVTMTTVARNAGGTVDHIINKGLVDMSGRAVIDKSVADAFKMPDNKQRAFDEYLYHLHNIDRMREGKPIFGDVTSRESRNIVSELENAHPEFRDKALIVRKTLDELLNKWGVESGLVSPELRDLLQEMYKNYVPTYRSLEGADAIATKTRTAGAAKIINNAVGGDEPLITLRETIPMLINKTVKAARKNEVYRGILEATRVNPKNGFARILGEDSVGAESIQNSVIRDGLEGIASNSEKALEADPKLGYLLTVMEDGKPVKLQIKKELFDSLQALNKVDDTSLHQALQTVKKYATNPFKALITGYNPFFAIRNVARDIPTAYIQGTENNPLKFTGNLFTAGKDILSKNPRYKEFQALGGQGSNFFNIEKGGIQAPGKLKNVGRKIGGAISFLNNFTETLPRYGEYLGTLKRGGEGYSNKMQGLHNAAEVTVNFGRHGDVTKAIDSVVPYLNPAVQGLDKFRKTMMKPEAYAKALGVITVPTAGIYAINQIVDKSGYDQIDNRTKDTYFLIPEKLWGGESGKFIKIAKSREAGVLFGTLFERIARTIEGQQGSFKGFANTLKTNFIPNDPISSNFFSPAINVKYTNKDFANRDIVPSYMKDYYPRLQYDEKTSEISKTIGDKLNLSPKQIDYLVKSYGGVIASLLLPATTKGGPTVGNVISRNFTADANYNNDIQNNFYDQMDGLRKAASSRNFSEKIPSKTVTNEEAKYNSMAKISKQLSDLRKQQLRAQQSGDQISADAMQAKLLDMAKRATK